MIFPSFFSIDNYNLLEPEGKLDKQIPLQKATYLSVWPVGPDSLNVEPILRTVHDILSHVNKFPLIGVEDVPPFRRTRR
jgi:hypothetical protein